MFSGDLPDEVKPIWVEGVLTSEYERDTLPLLFSTNEVFQEYYDALCEKNPPLAAAIKQVQLRNLQAREQRAAGYWQECLASLSQCIHLRRCIFEDDHFQYTGAVNHFLLSVLNFASFFLRESANDPKTKEVMLIRAFDLFKKSQDSLNSVSHIGHRAFFKAMISNNFANYFHRRRKEKAASQCTLDAMKAFSRSRVSAYAFYFQLSAATSYVSSGRFDDAIRKLQSALGLIEQSLDGSNEDEYYDPYDKGGPGPAPPIRFTVQMLFSDMPIMAACELACCHNMAAAYAGLHKYDQVAQWCGRAMQVAQANEAFLKASHPWIRAIKRTQAFCAKMAFAAAGLQRFSKPNPEDQTQDDLEQMQKALGDKSMAAFNMMLISYDQKRQGSLVKGRLRHQEMIQDANPKAKKGNASPGKPGALKRGGVAALAVHTGLSEKQLRDEILVDRNTPRILQAMYKDNPRVQKAPAGASQAGGAEDLPCTSADEGEFPPPAARITEGTLLPEGEGQAHNEPEPEPEPEPELQQQPLSRL